MEVVRLAAVRWLYPGIPLTLLIPLLLVLGLLVPVIAGVDFSQVGLRRWCDWTPTEKSYFLQVIVLANVIFPIALGARLAQPVTAASLSTVVVPYLFFGFYQELVYRAGGPVISGWSESFMRSETPISPGASDPVGDSPTQTAHRAS